MVTYRAAINIDGVVICIGYDENQSGNYLDLGTWCNFTFQEIPTISQELLNYKESSNYMGSLLKVINSVVIERTIAEIESE